MKPVVVAYVPVIHKGYKQFFTACAERGARTLFLLAPPFTEEFLELSRDLRALSVREIQAMAKTLSLFSSVEVLSTFVGIDMAKQAERVFLPDEDVSHSFAEKHLFPGQAEFLSFFLRYDMRALSEQKVPERHRAISASGLDRELMRKAYDEAKQSPDWWRHIGAVLAKDGQVIFSAHNRHLPHMQTAYVFGDPRSNFKAGEQNEFYLSLHAEAVVIAFAARCGTRATATLGASLYLTTFPCPSCARLIAQAGIARVYYAEGYSSFDSDKIFARAGVQVVHVAMQ